MASSSSSLSASQFSESRKPCDINNLMSPPEPPKFESFGSNADKHAAIRSKSLDGVMSDARRIAGPVPPLSPPISPATRPDDVMNVIVTSTQDPILYPTTHDLTNSPPQRPLFVREESADARQIVNDHVLARPVEFFKDATPPEQDDYELVLYFKSQVMRRYLENPGSWLKRERALLIADRQAQARHRHFKLHPILPAKPQPIRREVQRVKPTRAARVTKPATAKPAPARPRPLRAGPGPATAASLTVAVAPGLMKHVNRAPSGTPDPSPRRATTQTRADDDFNSVPDFCPPLSSMPDKISSLKMEWKTGITDLSNDPHRHLLHPEEINLASSLRLTAAVYLTSKRRIFVKRLECLSKGKEFRKTDAQQACKIDVNKASKLWVAFDKIGWLDKKYVSQYL
ncbi:SWIRM domain-containing protein [Nemania serpens]|nr:SWIRM domain-containing protein [Nemania serpens]